MGTTLDTMGSSQGIRLGHVFVIEGYERLITDHPSATTVSEIGWSGFDWSLVERGLVLEGNQYARSIEPWQRSFNSGTLGVRVLSDQLGADMFAVGAGNETTLTTEIDPNDTAIAAADTTDFAASGSIYIGQETIAYTGKTATSFTGITRGKFHPFATDAGTAHRFGRDHSFTGIDRGVEIKSLITDSPRNWIGRWVGLWAHRIVGTQTWDTEAQAQLIFAGKITAYEDTPDGVIVIECADVFDTIKSAVVFHDQWSAELKSTFHLSVGMHAIAQSINNTSQKETTFEVVASGASGTAEIDAGEYEVAEIIERLNEWLADADSAGDIDGSWALKRHGSEAEGWRAQIEVRGNGTFSNRFSVIFGASPDLMSLLGFTDARSYEDDDGKNYRVLLLTGSGASTLRADGDLPPATGGYAGLEDSELVINVEQPIGTFVDQAATLPVKYRDFISPDNANAWGVVQLGSAVIAIAEQLSATQYRIYKRRAMTLSLGGGDANSGDRIDQNEDGTITVKQLFVWETNFEEGVKQFFASTGATGYNETSADALPSQLGLAIPYSLLSTAFEDSIADLVGDRAPMLVVLEKPTTLSEIILPELLIRGSHLIWRDQHLEFISYATPDASHFVHTFTESNKAGAPGDPQRAPGQLTDEHLVNVVKVKTNRSALKGDYRDTDIFKFARSIANYGQSKPFTINARNTFGQWSGVGAAFDQLTAFLVAEVLPLWGEPVIKIRRTVSQNFFEDISPGDLCTVTDSHVRDPATGTRGLSTKPGVIMAHRYDWGDSGTPPFGEVDIMILPLDRHVVYSPAAHIDNTAGSNGYEADTDIDGNAAIGNSRLTFRAHEYTNTSEDVDIDYFNVGDQVRVLLKGGGSEGTGEIVALDVASNRAEVDFTFASGAPASTDRLYMQPMDYNTCDASQRFRAFQADDADQKIQDAAPPYLWGRHDRSVFQASASTDHYARKTSFQYGDGYPFTPEHHANAARWLNQMIDFRTATHSPQLNEEIQASNLTDYVVFQCYPFWLGRGKTLQAGIGRNLTFEVMARVTSGSARFRITVSQTPPGNDAGVGLAVSFNAPYLQASATTSATSLTAVSITGLRRVGSANAGWGFVTLETKAESGTPTIYCCGITRATLGKREAI